LEHFLDAYFESDKYIVFASAYAKARWCVPIGKSLKHEALTGSERKFNYFLSRARVSIEYCFGALKGKFPSLDKLRIHLNEEENMDSYNPSIATYLLYIT
jgi:hypothetical protein